MASQKLCLPTSIKKCKKWSSSVPLNFKNEMYNYIIIKTVLNLRN